MVIDHVSQIQNILIKLNVGYFSYNLFTTKLIYENEDTDIFSNPPDSSNLRLDKKDEIINNLYNKYKENVTVEKVHVTELNLSRYCRS